VSIDALSAVSKPSTSALDKLLSEPMVTTEARVRQITVLAVGRPGFS
jgi:hypothetical protein